MEITSKISELLVSGEPKDIEKGLRMAEGSKSPQLLSPLFNLATNGNSPASQLAKKLALKKSLAFLKGAAAEKDSAIVPVAKKIVETLDPSFVLHLNYKAESGNVDEMVDSLILLKYFVSRTRAEEILKLCIRNPEKKVRATAVRHIGEIASKVNAEVLARFLDDSDNRVKANAIEVFESLNNKYFTRILKRFRSDPNNRVRANALKVLFQLGETAIEHDLEKMLLSPGELMRASAVWVIGELGAVEPKLLELLSLLPLADESEIVQNNLLIVLKKVGEIPKTEFIRESLRDLLKSKLKNTVGSKSEIVVETSSTGDYTLFKLQGILTAQTILNVKMLVEENLKHDKIFVLDFTELDYLDSSGVGFIINFQKKLKAQSGSLYIFGCSFKILEMMQISKLDMIIDVYNTRNEIHEFLGLTA